MTAFFCYTMSWSREWNLHLLHSGSQIHFKPLKQTYHNAPTNKLLIIFRTGLFTKQHKASSTSALHARTHSLMKTPRFDQKEIRWRSPPRKKSQYMTETVRVGFQPSPWTVPTRRSGNDAPSACRGLIGGLCAVVAAVPHGRRVSRSALRAPPARSWPCPRHRGKPRGRLHRLWRLRW